MTPNQVLGDVMTDDTYRDDKEENKKDEKKKSVVFKATSSSKGKAKQEESSNDEYPNTCDEEDGEAMSLFVKRFGKFMMKKGYRARRKKRSSNNKDEPRRCFKCNSKDHLIADCPHNSDNNDDKNIKKKGKKESKMIFKKKKKGGSYVVTWDSDASTSDDDSDDKKTSSKKKALASVAINKPSLFDSPSCFMAKGSKVQYYDESDIESDSDNNDEPTKDELIDMLEDARDHFDIKRKECKELRKSNKALEQSFEELKASHERLMEAHEKLKEAHTKLEKAHSSLVAQNKKEQIQTSNKGLTCNIIDESFYKPSVIAPTNPSCSTSNSTSSTSDGFTSDSSLMVQNETLKKQVNELTHALDKAYGGEARLLKCLDSQRFSLNKEGLGYTPKNGKATFTTQKTSFVKGNGPFCTRCKQVGHVEQACKNKKNNTNVSSIVLILATCLPRVLTV
ncbi:uncharacterized protein [Miscanthus floridulus]|uniref:uncharacterized protein n=1 Tax=Miscanthus floridulus TaxID=154761 RepID=UPI003459B6B5